MKGRIISISVALLLLVALIYVSGPSKIAEVLVRTNLAIAATGLIVMSCGAVVRTERWRYLLRSAGMNVPFFDAMKVYVASLFISNVTPGKSGDPIRSVLLKKVSGNSVGASLPSVIVERALDVASMIVLGGIGLATVASSATSSIMPLFIGAITVYVVAFAVALFSLSSEARARWAVKKFSVIALRIPKIKDHVSRADGFMLKMQSSLAAYNNKKIIAVSLAYSLAVWALEGVIFYIAFASLGFSVGYMAVLAALCITTLISVLTFLPGGIGSGEILMVAFLTAVTSLSMADITAAAIVTRFLSYWVYVAAGAILLATMKYEYKV